MCPCTSFQNHHKNCGPEDLNFHGVNVYLLSNHIIFFLTVWKIHIVAVIQIILLFWYYCLSHGLPLCHLLPWLDQIIYDPVLVLAVIMFARRTETTISLTATYCTQMERLLLPQQCALGQAPVQLDGLPSLHTWCRRLWRCGWLARF